MRTGQLVQDGERHRDADTPDGESDERGHDLLEADHYENRDHRDHNPGVESANRPESIDDMVASQSPDQHARGEEDDTGPRKCVPASGVVDQEKGAPVEGRTFDEYREAARQHQPDGQTSGSLSLAS